MGSVSKGTAYALFIVSLSLLRKHASSLGNLPPFAFMKDAYEIAAKYFPWVKDTVFK